MQPAILSKCELGSFRLGVIEDYWDTIVDTLEAAGGEDDSLEVTRRRLILHATRDSTTGWYDKDYVESTIDMVIAGRAQSHLVTRLGTYMRGDYAGFTCDPVLLGDEVKKGMSTFYEVKTVEEVYDTGGHFLFRKCDLTLLPMHDLSYSDTTPTVADARSNTKDYWEAYLSISNLNRHSYIVCYSGADYPLAKVFETKGIHIAFTIDQGTAESLMGVRRREHVPTHVITLDTELQWLGEEELRRIVDEHPEGSLRTLTRTRPLNEILGSPILYDTEFMLNYTRTSARGKA